MDIPSFTTVLVTTGVTVVVTVFLTLWCAAVAEDQELTAGRQFEFDLWSWRFIFTLIFIVVWIVAMIIASATS